MKTLALFIPLIVLIVILLNYVVNKSIRKFKDKKTAALVKAQEVKKPTLKVRKPRTKKDSASIKK